MRPSVITRRARQLLWLSRTRRWSRERIRAYQERALGAVLQHAVATVPHYRDLGIDPRAVRGSESLAAFAVITKADVQREGERFLSEGYDLEDLYASRTSGSTGQPTTTYFDADAWFLTKHAVKLRRTISDIGLPPYRVLVIGEERGGRPSTTRFTVAGACRVSIHEGAGAHVDVFQRLRPTGVYGPPSWLLEMLQEARRRGVVLPRPRVVWTSSEVLTPGARGELETEFGGGVRDVYGSTEFKEVAAECRFGRRHVNFETSYVEVLGSGPDRPGSLVITSLVNRAMPLIRYDIGDLGRLAEGSCECGRAGMWVEELAGRRVDLIEIGGGRRISPYVLSTAIESDAAIARYRLVQRSPRHVEVQYQLRSGSRLPEITDLTEALRRATGHSLEFSFRRVERMDRTPSGKHLVLIRPAGGDALLERRRVESGNP